MTALVARSKAYRLNSPSRSDRKKSLSPTHIGSVSLQRPAGWGTCSTAYVELSKSRMRAVVPPR